MWKAKFNSDQFDMLIRCSKKLDMTEWNDWREKNQDVEICLDGADFRETHLEGVNLQDAWLERADFESAELSNAHFEKASLRWTSFKNAVLGDAHLNYAMLNYAIFERAYLWETHLEGAVSLQANFQRADLSGAHLEGGSFFNAAFDEANFHNAHLENTVLQNSYFQKAYLRGANLKAADLSGAHLEGAKLEGASLEGAVCRFLAVDGNTLVRGCSFNQDTDFTGVGLDAVRIEPRIRTALKNNIRRKQWRTWYSEGTRSKKILINPFVWCFWKMTDYGSSTARIIFSFLCLSILFGMIYFSFGIVPCLHSIVHDLHPEGVGMSIGHILARAMYFSIVTMTTLGFGDMHATKTGDIWGLLGYMVLSVQVIFGYSLLGALITRLGILFSNDGPALDPKASADAEDFKKLSGEDILRVKIIEEPLESTTKL